MIYLFTIKIHNDIIHKFYMDGMIYIHNISMDVYLYDSDYKKFDTKSCEKFEYELPNSLNIIEFFVSDYIKDIDKYIEINILNSI